MVKDDDPNGANMYIHLLSVYKYLWCDITEGPFIPKNDDKFVKHPKDWNDVETKKGFI